MHVERTASDWGSGRFKTKAEEWKGRDTKKGKKLPKEGAMKETMYQIEQIGGLDQHIKD